MNKINYDKHDWIDGEPITETLFNNIESGVGRATSSTNLLVDRTNQEEESLSTIEGRIEHQDMEFDIAIGEHDTLDERLKADVSRFVEVWSGGNYMPFEGKNITIDNSKVGWIRDFKMSGETYQDPNNLSDIQSAGDLVDGRYKIEILSRGKNLYKPNLQTKSAGGLTFSLHDNTLIVNGTATDTVDFRPVNEAKDIITLELYNYVNKLPVGTTLRLSNNLGLRNFFGISRNGAQTYIANTLTIQEGDYCITCFVRFEKGQSYNNAELKIQLEINNVATEYAPYVEDKTQILLDEPLMKLPDGTCDTIEQRDDGVYLVQRIEKVAYVEGDENLGNCITDKTISYKAKATPIETKLDLDMSKWLTYQGMTYFTTTCNVQPTLSLKAPVNIQAIVSNLQTANYSLRRNNQQLEQKNQQAEKELNTLQEQHDQQTADLLDMDMRVLMLEE